jgi:hypothetical protein
MIADDKHPRVKQVNPLAQITFEPDIETNNPYILAGGTPQETTFQAYRHWCREVFERQHGVKVATVLATRGAEIVNRDAQAYSFRHKPLDLTPPADEASQDEWLNWPSERFWNAVLATVDSVVQHVEEHGWDRRTFKNEFISMSDEDIDAKFGRPKAAKNLATRLKNFLEWLVYKVGMDVREANVLVALCAIDKRIPMISDITRRLHACAVPGNPWNGGVDSIVWILAGTPVRHRVMVVLGADRLPQIVSATRPGDQSFLRRDLNAVRAPYCESESGGEPGIVLEANAAETLANAYATGKFNSFGTLVPDTSKSDDNAANQ